MALLAFKAAPWLILRSNGGALTARAMLTASIWTAPHSIKLTSRFPGAGSKPQPGPDYRIYVYGMRIGKRPSLGEAAALAGRYLRKAAIVWRNKASQALAPAPNPSGNAVP
jgi:hypothetical protein